MAGKIKTKSLSKTKREISKEMKDYAKFYAGREVRKLEKKILAVLREQRPHARRVIPIPPPVANMQDRPAKGRMSGRFTQKLVKQLMENFISPRKKEA